MIHSLQPGGAEDSLVALARVAPEVGLEMQVLSLLPIEGRRIADELLAAGVSLATLGLGNRWDPRALSRGITTIRSHAPDIVHTHLKHADIVGSMASRRLAIPMVSTLHLVDDRSGGLRRPKRRVAALARERAATITIAVSEAQRSWYLRELGASPDRVVTVHNGVADAQSLGAGERQSMRDALGVRSGELMATMVGIMRPGKGHHDLLSLARALGPGAGVRFILAGDGPLRAALEDDAAAQIGVAAPVVFAGYRNDIPALLSASDLVVHPSHADALPTALLQALAAGRPILASRVGGIPEIVTPEVGVLTEPGDTQALLAAFRELVADPEGLNRLGAGARTRYEAEFEVHRWARRLRRVYEQALGAQASDLATPRPRGAT